MSNFLLGDFLRVARESHAHAMLEGDAYREAPETKRYVKAWEDALAKHHEWKDILARLRPKLPDATIWDTTAPTAIAGRRCCVYMTRFPDSAPKDPHSVIVAMASVLVPHYHIYWVSVDAKAGKLVRSLPLPRPHEGAEGAVADTVAS